MARDNRAPAGRPAPHGVLGALIQDFRAVLAQAALQRAALQDASGSKSGARSGSAVWSGSGRRSAQRDNDVLACLRARASLADRTGDLFDLRHDPVVSTVGVADREAPSITHDSGP